MSCSSESSSCGYDVHVHIYIFNKTDDGTHRSCQTITLPLLSLSDKDDGSLPLRLALADFKIGRNGIGDEGRHEAKRLVLTSPPARSLAPVFNRTRMREKHIPMMGLVTTTSEFWILLPHKNMMKVSMTINAHRAALSTKIFIT